MAASFVDGSGVGGKWWAVVRVGAPPDALQPFLPIGKLVE